jgi:hypothetical protein
MAGGEKEMHACTPTRNFFCKHFADSTIVESPKKFSSNLKYKLKNKYPHLTKNFTKRYHSVVTTYHLPLL